MKIKALVPWFGGKRTLAPDIVEQLGPHTQYFEPFCGSMAVLLAKPTAQKETANDLHGDVVNLARVLADRGRAVELHERLAGVLMCEAVLDDARAHLADENLDPLDRAFWYFLASWQGRNGTAGTVVSYYDCPRVRDLYAAWSFVEKPRHKHLHVQNGRGSARQEVPELLIVKGGP